MNDTVERFSNRVENYVKYRPDYPREIIDYLAAKNALKESSVVADIGCGPGISSRMFLENGNRVFGVEPNAAMLSAAEALWGEMGLTLVNGTSDATTLDDASVDLIVAAQAFHWFDRQSAKKEFKRILRPQGHVAIIWNERQLDTTPFLQEYEEFLLKFGGDYAAVRHEGVTPSDVREFLGPQMQTATFRNEQIFDLDGLKGRMLSASYMPVEGAPVFNEMIDELRALFAKHERGGRINILYDTNVYLSRL